MPRDSAERGPRTDDELKRETEGMVRGGGPARAEERERPEPLEESPGSAVQMPPERQAGGVDMSAGEVAWRSRIAQALASLDYPADRGRILALLEREHAPDPLITAMLGLPKDRRFHNVGEIARAIGIHTERHRI